jgi:hypothetical protein
LARALKRDHFGMWPTALAVIPPTHHSLALWLNDHASDQWIGLSAAVSAQRKPRRNAKKMKIRINHCGTLWRGENRRAKGEREERRASGCRHELRFGNLERSKRLECQRCNQDVIFRSAGAMPCDCRCKELGPMAGRGLSAHHALQRFESQRSA